MTQTSLDDAKNDARMRSWDALVRAGASPAEVHGRIPDFEGAGDAAQRLAGLDVWKSATVIKAVPDTAQQPVRALALGAGKVVYMAVPRLANAEPFLLLDPAALLVDPTIAADRREATRVGQLVDVEAMPPIDLVVTGSVAVDLAGARLGKGAGYGDIEVALLAEAGLIGPATTIVTTVHDLQVVEGPLPEAGHDFHVDLIVTPTRTITTRTRKRPAGIDWATMPRTKIEQIPVLAARWAAREGSQRTTS